MRTKLLAATKALAAMSLVSGSVVAASGAFAQPVKSEGWADAADPLALQLIEQERKWATLSCTPISTVVAYGTAFINDFIADDFVGTHPRGSLYSKSDMLTLPKGWEPERDCKLLGARVRFFAPDIAVIYGSESAVAKGPGGKYSTRTLVWTDTLRFRAGKWQVIAVQDMTMPAK